MDWYNLFLQLFKIVKILRRLYQLYQSWGTKKWQNLRKPWTSINQKNGRKKNQHLTTMYTTLCKQKYGYNILDKRVAINILLLIVVS